MQAGVSEFHTALNHCRLVAAYGHQVDANKNYVLPRPARDIVIQAAFVRLYISFEEFLEYSFGHYGMSLSGVNGTTPRAYANAPTATHLHDMVTGTQRFVDWSTPSTVVKLAKLYFENGEPYASAIGGAQQHLADMKTVRNGCSHVSRTTTIPLEALYRRWTGHAQASVTAYDVLTAKGVSQHTGHTFMGFSESILTGLVSQVASP